VDVEASVRGARNPSRISLLIKRTFTIDPGMLTTGHGHLRDISAEAVSYGLMTASTFYAQ
jgi:hypothetical protein